MCTGSLDDEEQFCSSLDEGDCNGGDCVWELVECPEGCGNCTLNNCSKCDSYCSFEGCSDEYAVNYNPYAVGGSTEECFDTWLWHTVDNIDKEPQADCEGWTLYQTDDNHIGTFQMDGCDGCTSDCGGKWRVRDWRINPAYGPEDYLYPGSPAHSKWVDGNVPGMYTLKNLYSEGAPAYDTFILSEYEGELVENEWGIKEAGYQHSGIDYFIPGTSGKIGLGASAPLHWLKDCKSNDISGGCGSGNLAEGDRYYHENNLEPLAQAEWVGLTMPQTPASVSNISVGNHLLEFDMKIPGDLLQDVEGEPQIVEMAITMGNQFENMYGDSDWSYCGGAGNNGIRASWIFTQWDDDVRESIAGTWTHVRVGANRAELGAFQMEKDCVGDSTFSCNFKNNAWDSTKIAYEEFDNGFCGNGTSISTDSDDALLNDYCDLFPIRSQDQLISMCEEKSSMCSSVGQYVLADFEQDAQAKSKWYDPIMENDKDKCETSPYVDWVMFGKSNQTCHSYVDQDGGVDGTVPRTMDGADGNNELFWANQHCLESGGEFSDGDVKCANTCQRTDTGEWEWCPNSNSSDSYSPYKAVNCRRNQVKDRCIANFTWCGGFNGGSFDCNGLDVNGMCNDYYDLVQDSLGNNQGSINNCNYEYSALDIASPIQSDVIDICGSEENLYSAGIEQIGIWFRKSRALPIGITYPDCQDGICNDGGQEYAYSCTQVGSDGKQIGLIENNMDDTLHRNCGVGSWGYNNYSPNNSTDTGGAYLDKGWPFQSPQNFTGDENQLPYVNEFIYFDNFRLSANRIESGLGSIDIAHLEAANSEWGYAPHLYGILNTSTDISWQYDNSVELGLIDDSIWCNITADSVDGLGDLSDGNPGNQGCADDHGLRVSGCDNGGQCQAVYYQGDTEVSKQQYLESKLLPIHSQNLLWRATNEHSTGLGGGDSTWYLGYDTDSGWKGEWFDSQFGDWVRNTNQCIEKPTIGRQNSRVIESGWIPDGSGLWQDGSHADGSNQPIWGVNEGDSTLDYIVGPEHTIAEVEYMPGCGPGKFIMKSFPNMEDPCHDHYQAFGNGEWSDLLDDSNNEPRFNCPDDYPNCNLTSIVDNLGQCSNSPADRKICRTGGDVQYNSSGVSTDSQSQSGTWGPAVDLGSNVSQYNQYSCSSAEMKWNDWHYKTIERPGTVARWYGEYDFTQAMQSRDEVLQKDILDDYYFPGEMALLDGGYITEDQRTENAYYYFSVRAKGKTGMWSVIDGMSSDEEYWFVCTYSFISGGPGWDLGYWNRGGVNHAAQLWLFPLPKSVVRDTWLTSTPSVVMWGKRFGNNYDDHSGRLGDTGIAKSALRNRHPEIFGEEPHSGPLRNASFYVYETPDHSHTFGDERDRVPEWDTIAIDDGGEAYKWKIWPGAATEDTWTNWGTSIDEYEIMYGQIGSCSYQWCKGNCFGSCVPNILWDDDVLSCQYAKRRPKDDSGETLNSFFGTWSQEDCEKNATSAKCGATSEGRFTPYPIYANYGTGEYSTQNDMIPLGWGEATWNVNYASDGTFSGQHHEWWNFISFAVVIYPPRFLHLSKNTYTYSTGTCLDSESSKYLKKADGTDCTSSDGTGLCTDIDFEGCPLGFVNGNEEGCPATASTCCQPHDNGSCWG